MKERADILTRAGLLAVILGLAAAYWLGAERSGELRFAVEAARRHEARLDEHERRLAAHDATLGEHAAALAAQERKTEALEGEVAKLREEVTALEKKGRERDAALRKVLERLDRLEGSVANRALQ